MRNAPHLKHTLSKARLVRPFMRRPTPLKQNLVRIGLTHTGAVHSAELLSIMQRIPASNLPPALRTLTRSRPTQVPAYNHAAQAIAPTHLPRVGAARRASRPPSRDDRRLGAFSRLCDMSRYVKVFGLPGHLCSSPTTRREECAAHRKHQTQSAVTI